MLQPKRKEEILNLLHEHQEYKIEDLCHYFRVSVSTIHRDLNELEREGRVKKVHGGVLLKTAVDIETRNTIRLRRNIGLKERIAAKALAYVHHGDCLFIDNSTTCYYFAKTLAESDFQDLLVITNSYIIPGLFLKNKHIQVICTGGLLLKEYSCFVGSYAIGTVTKFNGDIFFLSTAAVSVKGGLSDAFRPDSDEVKACMHKRCRQSICLVDSTKFAKNGPSRIFSVADMDRIVTDQHCSRETREAFIVAGMELDIA